MGQLEIHDNFVCLDNICIYCALCAKIDQHVPYEDKITVVMALNPLVEFSYFSACAIQQLFLEPDWALSQ